MGKIKKIIWILSRLNISTIKFNLSVLPLRQALLFPFLCNGTVTIINKGTIILNVSHVTPFMVRLGEPRVGIFNSRTSHNIWKNHGVITFQGSAVFGQGFKISVEENAELVVGSRVSITAETAIIVSKKITIGDECLLSWNITLTDSDFHTIHFEGGSTNADKEIVIGNKVWIGFNCQVLKGTIIPANVIIGAGSVLSSKLEESGFIYAGNPARKVKAISDWHV